MLDTLFSSYVSSLIVSQFYVAGTECAHFTDEVMEAEITELGSAKANKPM
jgi:hypothetical protein